MLKISTFGPVTRFDLARTMAGQGRYWTTCYLVDGLLIDSGCAFTARELQAAIQTLADSKIYRLVNTHTHEDHIGANGLLQSNNPGLDIFAHPLALPVLADPVRRQPLHPYRRLFWGWPKPSRGMPLADGDMVKTEYYSFQAIYTPGHSADHICLYEPQEGWLFSGDLFVGGKDRAMRKDHVVWQAVESLQRIAKIPLAMIFPGCARVRENPTAEIEQKIHYYQSQGEQVLALHRQGCSVAEIVKRVCGQKPMWVEIVTLGHFSRQQLVLSYLKGENGKVS